jgi:hypothetical protein
MQYESAEKENSRSLVPLQGAGRQTPRVLPPQGDICLDIFFYRTGLWEVKPRIPGGLSPTQKFAFGPDLSGGRQPLLQKQGSSFF